MAKIPQSIKARVETTQAVLRVWRASIVGFVSMIALYDLAIAQILPQVHQEKLPLISDLPPKLDWQWWIWAIILLVITLILVLEGAHRKIHISGLQVAVEGKGLAWVRTSQNARLGIRGDRLYNIPNVRLVNNEPRKNLIEFRLCLSTAGHEAEEFVAVVPCLLNEVGGSIPPEGPVQHLPTEIALEPDEHVRGHIEFLVHGYYGQINPSDTGISEKVKIIDLLTNRERVIIEQHIQGFPAK